MSKRTMVNRVLRLATSGLLALTLAPVARVAEAQKVMPAPSPDLNRLTGAWYEVARYPAKNEKSCVSDSLILYALGDKKDSFQVVTSCQIKGSNFNYWNNTGSTDGNKDGRWKLHRLLIFSSSYWVLAVGPDYEWALVGTPNHRSLWLLSRTAFPAADVLSEMKAKAAANGFQTDKLIPVVQH